MDRPSSQLKFNVSNNRFNKSLEVHTKPMYPTPTGQKDRCLRANILDRDIPRVCTLRWSLLITDHLIKIGILCFVPGLIIIVLPTTVLIWPVGFVNKHIWQAATSENRAEKENWKCQSKQWGLSTIFPPTFQTLNNKHLSHRTHRTKLPLATTEIEVKLYYWFTLFILTLTMHLN